MTADPSRRGFLRGTGAAFVAGALPVACAAGGGGAADGPSGGGPAAVGADPARTAADPVVTFPRDASARRRVVVSTWRFGAEANVAAWAALEAGVEHPLDAVEAGVRVTEADASIGTVGLGGRPNADGVVELDSAIMRGDTLDCGAVAALRDVLHPVSVARMVMEHTPHVLLVGDGALRFARSRGVPTQELLTDASRAAWERWREEREAARNADTDAAWTGEERGGRAPVEEDHDTIGMVVLEDGRFATAVTTSGWAFKLPGRVGDSPIVGAGGYCDDEAGACVASGDGEEMIRTCASFAVVEALRRGLHPQDAVEEVVRRMDRKGGARRPSVALLAVDPAGRVGAAAVRARFAYAITDDAGGARVVHVERRS